MININRSPLKHEIVFNDEDFAQKYAQHHQKMTEKFGFEYGQKLKACGFQKGKMIDVGCGAGGTAVVLAILIKGRNVTLLSHCEERSDEAISWCSRDCFASLSMTFLNHVT